MSNSSTQTSIPGVTVESPSSLKMILTMGGIGLIAGILIVMTYQLTFPIIKVNKAAALDRAVFDVVPGARTKSVFKLSGEELQPLEGDDELAVKYYACYDDAGRLVGVAVEASGQGFQDVLHVLYGYSPRCDCVVGLKVLESKETPGLGDKIQSDARFRSNFDSLDVALDSSGGMKHPVALVKHGEKTEPWQIEAITGATISSRAIATIIRESTAVSVPLIQKNLSVLEKGVE